jgi:glutamine phosphoribosylpyrophosphate amidotransferase
VAALGQRRVEASWHPDMAILPEVAQAHTAQHLAEVAAQSRVDFVERALAVQAMRSDVAKLEDQVRFRLLVVGSRKSGAWVVVCSRRGCTFTNASWYPKSVYNGCVATCWTENDGVLCGACAGGSWP